MSLAEERTQQQHAILSKTQELLLINQTGSIPPPSVPSTHADGDDSNNNSRLDLCRMEQQQQQQSPNSSSNGSPLEQLNAGGATTDGQEPLLRDLPVHLMPTTDTFLTSSPSITASSTMLIDEETVLCQAQQQQQQQQQTTTTTTVTRPHVTSTTTVAANISRTTDSSRSAPQLNQQRAGAIPPPTTASIPLKPNNPFRTPFYRVVTDGARRAIQLIDTVVPAAQTLDDFNTKWNVNVRHDLTCMLSLPKIGEFSVASDIGGRKSQEDRFSYCDNLNGRDDCFIFGVFDGTVGDFASETVRKLVVPHLLASHSWAEAISVLNEYDHERENRASSSLSFFPAVDKKSSHEKEMVSSETPGDAATTPGDVGGDGETATTTTTGAAAADFSGKNLNTSPVADSFTSRFFPLLADAMDEMYLASDSELIAACSATQRHYASSTSVVAVVAGSSCCIGHLGDSRAALGHIADGQLWANFVTDDHKPNQTHERTRIRRSGGSVEYLHNHNNKPFIRGGDFTIRKSRGEQPMQLQYSRAFGGKDLKMFGLSNEPDILCFKIEHFHTCLILASDGVWDVLSAKTAVQVATRARTHGADPARALLDAVLQEQQMRHQVADNLTAAVLFFATEANRQLL